MTSEEDVNSRLCWQTSQGVFLVVVFFYHTYSRVIYLWCRCPGWLWLKHVYTLPKMSFLKQGPVSCLLGIKVHHFSLELFNVILAKDFLFPRTSATWHRRSSEYGYATSLYWTMPAFVYNAFCLILTNWFLFSRSASDKYICMTCFHRQFQIKSVSCGGSKLKGETLYHNYDKMPPYAPQRQLIYLSSNMYIL